MKWAYLKYLIHCLPKANAGGRGPKINSISVKAKPIEKWGRKATGLIEFLCLRVLGLYGAS
jgi:hypothetical protein